MKNFVRCGRIYFLGLCVVCMLMPLSAQSQAGGGQAAKVWIIPITGEISPSTTAFVRREGRKAQAEGADCIVFEIDTFGGRVDSALQITSFIMSLKNIRTAAWVQNSADSMGVSWSAGALIAFSCAEIYMANGTSMGAAAPVEIGASGAAASGEKTVSAVRSQMAAIAERNNHPVGIALAMVDYDVELWEVMVDGKPEALTLGELEQLEWEAEAAGPEGETPEAVSGQVERRTVICPKGKLLSLTAGEAYRYGLVRALADDRSDLLAKLGGEEIGGSVPGIADSIISILTSGLVQAVLIVIGVVLIFLEINTPGFGIPGVGAIIAFALVFGSGLLLGKVGSMELILFLLGIGLLAVEIFLLPGFGITGITGLLLIGASLVFSMQDFVIPRFSWEWDILGRNTVVVTIGLIAAICGIAVIALLGPRIKIFDRLTLKTRITGTAGGPLNPSTDSADIPYAQFIAYDGPVAAPGKGAGDYPPEENCREIMGKQGHAVTVLRPSGKAAIEGQVYPVEADGLFIEKGKPVKVVRVFGNRIIVRDV
ncbi:MAG: nodulation protein NfeD [Treponema sp.]|nr:nodulation protein NfeD [Treponema sp.]